MLVRIIINFIITKNLLHDLNIWKGIGSYTVVLRTYSLFSIQE